MGGRLAIVGHGLVERQVLGPSTPAGPPGEAIVTQRRYRCRACKATLVVGPQGLIVRRRYGAGAIALALATYARGATSAAVRSRTSPSRVVGGSATDRWVTLARWIDAARRGEIFGVAGLGELGRRRVAEHVAHALAARAGHALGADLAENAFHGGAIAA